MALQWGWVGAHKQARSHQIYVLRAMNNSHNVYSGFLPFFFGELLGFLAEGRLFGFWAAGFFKLVVALFGALVHRFLELFTPDN